MPTQFTYSSDLAGGPSAAYEQIALHVRCDTVSDFPTLAQRKPPSRPTLLVVSDDVDLTDSRKPIFELCGFAVCSVCLSDFTSGLDVRPRFIMLCQTIKAAEAFECEQTVRNKVPRACVIRLTKTPHSEIGRYDLLLDTPIAPQSLVSEMMRLGHNYHGSSAVGR